MEVILREAVEKLGHPDTPLLHSGKCPRNALTLPFFDHCCSTQRKESNH